MNVNSLTRSRLRDFKRAVANNSPVAQTALMSYVRPSMRITLSASGSRLVTYILGLNKASEMPAALKFRS